MKNSNSTSRSPVTTRGAIGPQRERQRLSLRSDSDMGLSACGVRQGRGGAGRHEQQIREWERERNEDHMRACSNVVNTTRQTGLRTSELGWGWGWGSGGVKVRARARQAAETCFPEGPSMCTTLYERERERKRERGARDQINQVQRV